MSDAPTFASWWPSEVTKPDPRFAWPEPRAHEVIDPAELADARALLRDELVALLEAVDATTDDVPAHCAWRRLLALRSAGYSAHKALSNWTGTEWLLTADQQRTAAT